VQVNLLLELVGFVVVEIGRGIVELVGASSDLRKDRRLIRRGQVLCYLRAVDEPVHDIVSEWCSGTAYLSSGRLRFVPETGLDGERTLEVIDLHRAPDGPALNTITPSSTLRVVTPEGSLYWLAPTAHLDAIVEWLRPPPRP
jgi:hypothetical protein